MKNLIVAIFMFGITLQLTYQEEPLYFPKATDLLVKDGQHLVIQPQKGIIFSISSLLVKWAAKN